MKEKLVEIIIEEVNLLLDEPVAELNGDSCLFGENGLLDSMGLVSMIVAVEQAVEDLCDKQVILASAKAVSRKNSPFRTIDSFVEYVENLVKEGQNG